MSTKRPAILYVDDEQANRLVFDQTFGERFPIILASSAAEALEILKGGSVAVVVADQRMPVTTGNELLLRAKELYPEVVRMVITAYSDVDPIIQAVNEGLVARYVIKPWDREELVDVLAWGLETFALGRLSSALQIRLLQTERLITIGSIGSSMVHELNQPLTYVASNVDRLMQLCPSMPALADLIDQRGQQLAPSDRSNLADLAEELHEIASDLGQGCKLMHELMNGMRCLMRPQLARKDEAARRVDPMPVLRYALAVCRQEAQIAGASLEYDGPTSLPMVSIGYTELAQIMINLIMNAAQALQQVQTRGGQILMNGTQRTGAVHFSVRDDGPGMPEHVLQKVGTLFFTTRPTGTGLGLAQCRRLVEQAGGTLKIQSREDQGTQVCFSIPLADHGA